MRKLSKILTVMVLSLICAFSFGAAAVFAAPAEEKTLNVKYATLKFEDNVYILYAVESENIADTTAIKLLVWESVPAEYTLENAPDYTLNYYNVQNIEGTDYPVFCFNQLSAKQMTDEVYVCAYYDDGGTPVYSEPLKYSILQYAVNKMYDYENNDENLNNLLRQMLAYGAQAQTYFNYKTDRLANDEYYAVKVVGGTLEDGFNSGVYKLDETVTITAPETDKDGYTFRCWNDRNGYTVSEERIYSFPVSYENVTYTAVYNAPRTLTDIQVDSECSIGNYPNVTLIYSNGDSSWIDFGELTISGEFNNSVAGTYTFTVLYGEFTKTVTVTVQERSLKRIEVQGTCNLGEQPKEAWLYYNDGMSEPIPFSALKISGTFDYTVAGEYIFTVEYNGFTQEVTVRVIDPNDDSVTSISLEGELLLVYGDETKTGEIDLTGRYLRASKNNGESSYIPLTRDMLVYDAEALNTAIENGEQYFDITIEYMGLSTNGSVRLFSQSEFNGASKYINDIYLNGEAGREVFINKDAENPFEGIFACYSVNEAYLFRAVTGLVDESGNEIDISTLNNGRDNKIFVANKFEEGKVLSIKAIVYDNSCIETQIQNEGTLTVPVNSTAEDVKAALAGQTLTVEKFITLKDEGWGYSLGEFTITLTEDMLDTTGADFSKVGERVQISVIIDGGTLNISVTVVPSGEFKEYTFNGVSVSGVCKVYDGVILDSYNRVLPFTRPFEDNPDLIYVSSNGDGPDTYYVLDNNEMTGLVYNPSGEEIPAAADGISVFNVTIPGAGAMLVRVAQDNYLECYVNMGDENNPKIILGFTIDCTVTRSGDVTNSIVSVNVLGTEYTAEGVNLVNGNLVEMEMTFMGQTNKVFYDAVAGTISAATGEGVLNFTVTELDNVIMLDMQGNGPNSYMLVDLVSEIKTITPYKISDTIPGEANATEGVFILDGGLAKLVKLGEQDAIELYMFNEKTQAYELYYMVDCVVTREGENIVSVEFVGSMYTVDGDTLVMA